MPTLFDLIVTIDRAFQPRGILRGPAELREELNTGVMVRIAMLRLLTIHHLIHQAPGDTRSQWDLIDDQLEAIREKSEVQLQAYAILILRRDRQLFPGDVVFADVPAELILVPNALECDVEARSIVAQYGDEPPQAELSALLEREAALSL